MLVKKNKAGLSQSAAEKVLSLMQEENNLDLMLRVYIQGGGCSGFKYNFSFDDKVKSDDIIFNKTIIDNSSLQIINGSIIDFKKELIGNSFVINNPKANSSCGCGLSFSI